MKTVLTFRDYTRGFRDTPRPPQHSKRRLPRPFSNVDPVDKRRHLVGQIAGIVQELLNQEQLSHTDRRLLIVARVVQFLLADE